MDVSLIFGIIFTLIVIGFLLVYGMDILGWLFGFGGEAQVARTVDGLGKKIEQTYRLAEGSGSEFSLSFPKEWKLCFFNSSSPQNNIVRGWNPDQTTLYRINQSGYNAWYFKGGNSREDNAAGTGHSFRYLQTPSQKSFCAAGGTRVYLTRKWDWVEIEPI